MYTQVELKEEDLNLLTFLPDNIIITRLKEYFQKYHRKQTLTNCSSFVSFLLQGNFIEPNIENRGITFGGDFQLYTGQSLSLGDIVFTLYNKKISGDLVGAEVDSSTFYSLRRDMYEKAIKMFDVDKKVLTSESVIKVLKEDDFFNNFHFEMCLTDYTNNGGLFLSQKGIQTPASVTWIKPGPICLSKIDKIEILSFPSVIFFKRWNSD